VKPINGAGRDDPFRRGRCPDHHAQSLRFFQNDTQKPIDLNLLLNIIHKGRRIVGRRIMSETYENLAGASGRARFFRPKRFDADIIFAGEPPCIWFDDEEYALDNISANGAGCLSLCEVTATPSFDSSVSGVLRVTQRGRELFRAHARKARANIGRGGLFVGFSLDKDSFDLFALRRENARAISTASPKAARSAAVPDGYKSFCADVVNFIAESTDHINKFYQPIESNLSEEEANSLVLELAQAAEANWLSLIQEGNDLVRPLHREKKLRQQIKRFTERVVTSSLLPGEGWARSYYKPMGYPGDFRIMNYIYDGTPVGETITDKFLHQLSLVGSRPVKSRMEDLAKLIVKSADRRRGEEFNILSIGAGPARELANIAEAMPPETHLRAMLIDQESEALDFAMNAARKMRMADRVTVSALNISFKEMLNPSPLAGLFADKDLIYSSGLVDYLNPLMAQRFVKRVYQYLKPGGKLIIGNLNDLNTGMTWPCEYVVDWTLYFRSRDEMTAMASGAPDAKMTIESDYLDAIYFLILEKPA